MELVKIDKINYEDILEEITSKIKTDKEIVLSTIKDCIFYLPHKYKLVSSVIDALLKFNPEFQEKIEEIFTDSETPQDCQLSKFIYAKALGCIIELEGVDPGFHLFTDVALDTSNVNIMINNLKDFSNVNYITLYFIISILKNYCFSIAECLNELQNYSVNDIFEGVLWMIGKIDNIYLLNIILRLVEDNYTYDSFIFYCAKMPKPFRDLLLPFFYERFINKRSFIENISKLQDFIDESTKLEFVKYCSAESCSKLFDYKEAHVESISKDQFKVCEDKRTFYRDFCLLGSPSISHFLSYLELYKNEMRMNEEEQKIFLEIFEEIFVNRITFKNVIIGKMKKFQFIK